MKPFKRRFFGWIMLALLSILLVPNATVRSQDAGAESPIRLQAGVFDPLRRGLPEGEVGAASVNADGLTTVLVQFNGPVEATWAQQVAALGGQIVGYIPDNTHIVRLAVADVDKVASLPAVRWIGPYLAEYKVAPDLAVLSASAAQTAEIEVALSAFPGASGAALEAFLRSQGATITAAGQSSLGLLYRIRLPLAVAATLAQHPDISWIEPYLEPTTFNQKGRKIIGAEAVWQDFGYFGAGQIVAVSDSGLSVQGQLSPDFDGRLVQAFAPSEMNVDPACRAKTNFTDLHGHGTHVAGSVLGNGVRSGSNPANHLYTDSHAGVAPEARLVFMALNTDGSTGIQCIDLNGDFIARGYDLGARISTNSWGASDRGGYNLLSSLVDDYLWKHKDYLVLFAGGNAGPGQRTIGSPGTAKNVLTVGASENNRPEYGSGSDDPDTVTDFSSRGPTADGRVKPDVVTPGSAVLSVKGAQAPAGSFEDVVNADYATMSGTSMATPLTAGGAALVREWLGKTRNIPNPSGALMKAIIINGAATLPGAATPNMTSGYGRTDLKNTLNAQYSIIDDNVQGLRTGDRVTYTVQIVAANDAGVLAATASAPLGHTGQALTTLRLQATVPAVSALNADHSQLAVEALPGYQNARSTTPIPTAEEAGKSSLTPLTNPLPALAATVPTVAVNRGSIRPHSAQGSTFLQGMVGGGDFEDPDWTDYWQDVWLGYGVPLRTNNPNLVIEGEYSIWLGGTESDDSIWYPLAFPDEIDTSKTSYLTFDFGIFDEDIGFDVFCVALVDASGYFISPYTENPDCFEEDTPDDEVFTYTYQFKPADLTDLAGQTGYLVLFNLGDGVEPHLSAIIDNIELAIDFPDVTLTATPNAGPPGTTFLLTGKYNVPYGPIDICISPCSQTNYIKTVYADERGDMAAYLYSQPTIQPGVYPIQTVNFHGRRAETSITIGEGGAATLSVTPNSGPPGTEFEFTGSGFLPNDNAIAISVNGEALGTTGSNEAGEIAFSLGTQSNTPAGSYTVAAADAGGNNASTAFTVTALDEDDPSLTVTPTSGAPGATFSFTAANFTPSTAAQVSLDGTALGEITMDATGGVQLTLETTADIAPGLHTLAVSQGQRQATAQFEITGGGGGGGSPSGNGLHVTLAWTDPPAQTAAQKTLINNLDLTIDGPGGRVFGNGGASADTTNNVEVIRLDNLTPGNYVITVQAQSINGTFGAQSFALVATSRQNFEANTTNVDVSNPNEVGSVAGVIYADEDEDGTQDANEDGIGGATVIVTKSSTGFVRQATTVANGAYSFATLPAGSYLLTVVLPPPYIAVGSNTFTVQVATGSSNTSNVGAVVSSSLIYLPLVDR